MQEHSSGTQAATISTEHTLATITDISTYVLVVDCNAMAAGDTVKLRAKVKTLSGSTERLAYEETLSDVQASPVFLSVPIPTVHSVKFTLEQTAGTGRSFDWSVVALV